jgi:hypothetical protein
METITTKKKLTASERRFAMEMALLAKMTLGELLTVEHFRMPVGV